MTLSELLNVFVLVDRTEKGVAMYYYEGDSNGPRYSEEDILNMKLVFSTGPGTSSKLKVLSVYPSEKGGKLYIDLGS